jgi:restriction system protein
VWRLVETTWVTFASTPALREAYIHHFGNAKPDRTANAVAMIRKFRDDIQQGDLLVTYSQEYREYLVGEDQGQYEFRSEQGLVGEFASIRKVKWRERVSRDQLSQSARNSLGSVLTLFSLSSDVINEVEDRLAGKPIAENTPMGDTPSVETEFDLLRGEVRSKGHELIKDKIQSDHGLFVSTGGFTKEARYEAERATISVTLIDIDYWQTWWWRTMSAST